jgi:hypothetical protein
MSNRRARAPLALLPLFALFVALVPLGSAAIVWNFLPDFHAKVNYATGFRAPPIQDLAAVAGGDACASSSCASTIRTRCCPI